MTIEIPISVLVALFAINGGTLTAFLGAIVLITLRLGRLPTRQEHNELRNELKADMAQLRDEFKADMAQLRSEFKADMAQLRNELKADMAQLRNEFKAEIAQLRNEFKAEMAQLREELRDDFRRSHQQLMLALVNHSHQTDGQAVFTLPPETEPSPAAD